MYELHKAVGDVLLSIAGPDIQVLLDGDCGGSGGDIRIYGDKPPSYDSYLAAVDAALSLDGEIRVIVEVENSDIRPLYLCGKVLATAVSQYAKFGSVSIPVEK